VIERNSSLVCEKDLPFVEFNGVFGSAGLCEKCLRKCFWERAAGDGYFERIMALDAGGLTLDYVASEGGCEAIDAGKDEEVWLSCHSEMLADECSSASLSVNDVGSRNDD